MYLEFSKLQNFFTLMIDLTFYDSLPKRCCNEGGEWRLATSADPVPVRTSACSSVGSAVQHHQHGAGGGVLVNYDLVDNRVRLATGGVKARAWNYIIGVLVKWLKAARPSTKEQSSELLSAGSSSSSSAHLTPSTLV